jgi:hypothetical protein
MLVIEFNTGVFRIDLVLVHNANVGNAYGEGNNNWWYNWWIY